MLHRNDFSPHFLEIEKKLRDTCCEFLETANRKWKSQDKKIKGDRELAIYLPGENSLLRPLELNPIYQFNDSVSCTRRYERVRGTIKNNTTAIKSGEKVLRILGYRLKKQKMITSEYDPDKKFTDFLEKIDYDDMMTKLTRLSEACPPYIDQKH